MAGGLGSGVDGVVLRRGDDAEVGGVVALHTGDEGDGHAAGEEWIFAVGFLSASPAGVAKDIDVGGPEGEAEELFWLAAADGLVVFGAGFGGDGLAHGVDQLGVPCGGHADDLGEIGGVSGEGDAVEAFVPPVIFGDAEAGDGGGVVAHLLDLFFKRHLGDEGVDALVDGEGGVEPGLLCFGGLLGRGGGRDQEGGGEERECAKQRARAGREHGV